MQLRVAVRDPLPVFRYGIMAILRDAGLEAEAPEDLLAWARDDQRRVVLLTVLDPDDWELLERVLALRPDTVAVVVLADPGVPAWVRALRAGAAGVILRDANAAGVRDALLAVLNGRCVLPVEVVRALARPAAVPASEPPASPTELGWLQHLARGMTVGRLAATAGYSERMMFRLLHDLYEKIGAANRIEAVLRAREHGWIE